MQIGIDTGHGDFDLNLIIRLSVFKQIIMNWNATFPMLCGYERHTQSKTRVVMALETELFTVPVKALELVFEMFWIEKMDLPTLHSQNKKISWFD